MLTRRTLIRGTAATALSVSGDDQLLWSPASAQLAALGGSVASNIATNVATSLIGQGLDAIGLGSVWSFLGGGSSDNSGQILQQLSKIQNQLNSISSTLQVLENQISTLAAQVNVSVATLGPVQELITKNWTLVQFTKDLLSTKPSSPQARAKLNDIRLLLDANFLQGPQFWQNAMVGLPGTLGIIRGVNQLAAAKAFPFYTQAAAQQTTALWQYYDAQQAMTISFYLEYLRSTGQSPASTLANWASNRKAQLSLVRGVSIPSDVFTYGPPAAAPAPSAPQPVPSYLQPLPPNLTKSEREKLVKERDRERERAENEKKAAAEAAKKQAAYEAQQAMLAGVNLVRKTTTFVQNGLEYVSTPLTFLPANTIVQQSSRLMWYLKALGPFAQGEQYQDLDCPQRGPAVSFSGSSSPQRAALYAPLPTTDPQLSTGLAGWRIPTEDAFRALIRDCGGSVIGQDGSTDAFRNALYYAGFLLPTNSNLELWSAGTSDGRRLYPVKASGYNNSDCPVSRYFEGLFKWREGRDPWAPARDPGEVAYVLYSRMLNPENYW